MRHLSTFLSIVLVPLVAVLPMRAELGAAAVVSTASGETAGATTPDQSKVLKLRLTDDTKATVDANAIVKGYSVVVSDAAGLPVAGVAVSIRIPEDGATGYFADGEHSAVAYTDVQGVAKFPQLNWGATPGAVSVRVTAVKGDLHAGMIIDQTILAHTQTAPAAAPVAPFPAAATAPSSVTPANSAAIATPQNTAKDPLKDASVVASNPKAPGVPTSVASVQSGAAPENSAPVNSETAAAKEANVSVVNTAGSQGHGSNKKWLIIAAVVAGAGIGAALALSGKGGGGSTSTASPTTSIGAPTINVGH